VVSTHLTGSLQWADAFNAILIATQAGEGDDIKACWRALLRVVQYGVHCSRGGERLELRQQAVYGRAQERLGVLLLAEPDDIQIIQLDMVPHASYPAPRASRLAPHLAPHTLYRALGTWRLTPRIVPHRSYRASHLPSHASHHAVPLVLCAWQAVFDATEAFLRVKEFKGFYKPQQHFATHASINTLRMGPMRGCARASFRVSFRASFRASSHASFRASGIARAISRSHLPLMRASFPGIGAIPSRGSTTAHETDRKGLDSNFRNVSKRIATYWAVQFGLVFCKRSPEERRRVSNVC
jgi:hypothetical protein